MINKSSPDWAVIKNWLNARISAIHHEMEYPQSMETYNALRGSISLARELIEAVEPTTPPKVEEDDYGISSV